MKTIEDILAFIKEFEKTTLTSIEIDMADVKLKLTKDSPYEKRGCEPKEKPVTDAKTSCEGLVVKSPLVGTFFAASSPTTEPFISVGDHVKKGDTLCIIEAMKTMNEIKAPIPGKILRIHVKNGDFVGYDQVLVSIEHDA